jgi:uncharacterized protein (DUF4213/DUF364 family)
MAVIDDLLAGVPSGAPDFPVRDVLVGLYWTAVYGRHVGLAATPSETRCCFSTEIEGVGELHKHSINELVALTKSAHPLEVSIGMAAVNSLIDLNEDDGVELNVRDLLLERGRGRTVVTVGHFPFTDALRQAAARLWVLELEPADDDQPADAAPDLIPQADVIGLTATTLLNGTFDALARLFPPGAVVAMLGPSTPLSRVLFDYGVTILGGVVVRDPETAFHYVGQGSSLHGVPGIQRFTMAKHAVEATTWIR